MKLFRGDSLPRRVAQAESRDRGRTFADHFCGTGLLAKFGDGGSSNLLQGKDCLQLVIEHVGYERDTPAQDLADHSPMISFSTSTDRAFDFSERAERKRAKLESCTFEDATHFIWQLEFPQSTPEQPGVYVLTYRADPVNCRQLVAEQVQRGYAYEAQTGDLDGLMRGIMNAGAIMQAEADPREHVAVLIDVVTFVEASGQSGRDQGLIDRTLERAKRDGEWLLHPADPDGHGRSPKFHMNKYLSVHSYRRGRRCAATRRLVGTAAATAASLGTEEGSTTTLGRNALL